MADFNGIPPFAGPAALPPRPAPDAARRTVLPVEPADRTRPSQQHAPDPPTRDRHGDEAQRHTGPPPAFAANLLELERDLAALIARLEATRVLTAPAIGAPPDPDAR